MEEGISDKDTRTFIVKVRSLLIEKGIPLDTGWRQLSNVKVTSIQNQEYDEVISNGEEEEAIPKVQTTRVGNSRQKAQATTRNPFECYTCGRRGHGWRQCLERTCNRCGRKGHEMSQCSRTSNVERSEYPRYPKNSNVERSEYPRYPKREYRGKVMIVEDSIYGQSACNHKSNSLDGEESVSLKVGIAGRQVTALLDTGAKPSVIDLKTLSGLGLRKYLNPARSKVFGLCQSPVKVLGRIDVEVEIGQEHAVVRFYVLDSEEPTLLLGREFMSCFDRVTFEFRNRKIGLGSIWIPIESTLKGGTPLFRARTAMREATLAPVGVGSDGFNVNVDLDQANYEELRVLLNEYADLFASDPKKPGWTTSCEHVIDTGETAPIKERARRMPPSWEVEVERQLDEMVANGVCRPSHSPWAANVVLVRKKDNSMRFAIDYRRLNSVTKKDAYSLPNIQTILDKLEGSRYFSFVDVASAYWSVPVKKTDIEKTAFHTPRGQHEMMVMPFGLCNSQATFQRLMDNILEKVPRAESYVDDCCVFSRNFKEHLADLRATFIRIREGKVKLRRDKCRFGYEGGEFLGHYVSSEGRSPTQGATEKLRQFPTPCSLKELQRFIGSLNYYRSYIPNLARIAQPLYALTKKASGWEWTKDCQVAFDSLRRN